MINFMDDNQTGANTLQVTLQLPDGAPRSVQVKYVERKKKKKAPFFSLGSRLAD